MSRHLIKELEVLKRNLLSLTAVVEDTLDQALTALKNRDSKLARQVIQSDDEIDNKEVELEEECLKTLVLYQPVAFDLRYVVGILKINNDLERIGDLAVNIAERAVFLSEQNPIEEPFDFDTMAEKTRSMLQGSINALIHLDQDLAYEICKEDDEVDAMNRGMYDKVYAELRKNPDQVEPLIHYLCVSRHLERIADYATNIAEDIIYMIEGTIIRHKPEDYPQKKKDLLEPSAEL